MIPGPRGSRLIVDSASATPLVWFQVAMTGGSAGDLPKLDGLTNHVATLARRGAGSRDRQQIDEELDFLGASLEMSIDRDSIRLSGQCLRRNLDAMIALASDVLARPQFAVSEHEKLTRETRMSLDELRDDDVQLAARFFNRACVPGHPYARTAYGTEVALDRIEHIAPDELRAIYRRSAVPGNMIIGFAGNIDPDAATQLAETLLDGVPDAPPPTPPVVDGPGQPSGRRILLVDKPERTQSQLLIGHLGPRYGTREAIDFTVIETVLGGMFTSRLMQEVRVKRGWSYGAGCALYKSRGAHWFRIHLAPPTDVTPDAIELVLSMVSELATDGITADEFEFARGYLTGSLPFHLATPRQRVQVAIQGAVFGLSSDFTDVWSRRLQTMTVDDANEAARRWLLPDDTLCAVVATADDMAPRLDGNGWGSLQVVPYDSY